jgi:16S rRNA (guanine527-N7)-methyltransferase
MSSDVISARALAPLSILCGLAARHLRPEGCAIFPKGAQAEGELSDAATGWRFEAQLLQSKTDPTGRIITMKHIRHD